MAAPKPQLTVLPADFKPMLAQQAQEPFDSEAHLFEIKWDGIRVLASIEGRRIRLQSRHLVEITGQFPELECLGRLPSGTLLDGELVVLRDGKPSLRGIQQRALLQNRPRIRWLSQMTPVNYMIFDLLFLNGKSLMGVPFGVRRQMLTDLVERFPLPGVLVPEGVHHHGCQLFAQAARLGLEGVMAKRLDGPYLPGKRSRFWLKIKPKLFAATGARDHRRRLGTGQRGSSLAAPGAGKCGRLLVGVGADSCTRRPAKGFRGGSYSGGPVAWIAGEFDRRNGCVASRERGLAQRSAQRFGSQQRK